MSGDGHEFSLWQLFFGIIIIGLFLIFGAYGISNLINSFSSEVINETTVLDAAGEYAKDVKDYLWKKNNDYEIVCVSINELINMELIDKDVSLEDGIKKSDLVIVKRDSNSLNIDEVKITKVNDKDYKMCKNIFPEVKYTVKFYKNTASGIGDVTDDVIVRECTTLGSSGCIIKSPSIEANKGQSVVGWSRDKDSLESNWNAKEEKVVDGNYEYYAITKDNVVNIKYSVNGGKILTISNDNSNWDNDSDGVILLDDKELVSVISYNNSLSSDGLYDYNTINIGKTGYYVSEGSEWKCLSGCSGTYSQSKVYKADDFCNIENKSCDVVLGVNWKNAYTVKYNANGGSGAPGNQTKYPDKNLVLSGDIPTRSGYTFKGWNTKADGSGTNYSVGSTYSSNANVTLYAKWSKDTSVSVTYKITYNANGGNGAPGSQIKNEGEQITISNVKPIRSGYTFKNWNTKADGSGTSYNAGTTYAGNANLTLYAQWTKNTTTYTAEYDANGGSGAPSSQTKKHGVDLTLSTTKPTRNGYTFTGWNTKADGTGISYSSGSIYTKDANIILYAQWKYNSSSGGSSGDIEEEKDVYYIYYNANGGYGAPSYEEKEEGEGIYISYDEPLREGYVFESWNTKANGTGTIYKPGSYYNKDANLTLYAQWSIEESEVYIITYNSNGGSGAPSSQYKTMDCMYLSSVKPTRSGYTFKGWNTKANGSGTSYSAGGYYCGDADLNLYAQWTYNSSSGGSTTSYTITYNANGGNGAPGNQYKTTDCMYLSSVKPIRNGYTFKNWNTSANGTGTTYNAGGYYCGDANLTLYAQWSSNSSSGGGTGGVTSSHTHVVNAIGNTLRTVSRIKLSCGHYHTTVLYRYCSICGMSAYNISGEGMYACPCGPSYTYIFNDSVVGNYSAYKTWLGTTISPAYQLYTTSSFTRDCSGH